jgi:hypothetical protein
MAAEAIDGHPVLGEIIVLTLRVLEAMRVHTTPRVQEGLIQPAGSTSAAQAHPIASPGVV